MQLLSKRNLPKCDFLSIFDHPHAFLCCSFDNRGDNYKNFPPEGVFANVLSLIMALVVMFGVFLVADFDFRRSPLHTDEDI